MTNKILHLSMTKASYSAYHFLRNFKKNMYIASSAAMPLYGTQLVRASKKLIRDSTPFGARYLLFNPVKNRIVRHRASAPGQPPARFTGKLYRNIKFQPDGTSLHFGVDASIPYASRLETGGGAIAPRPYLAPAFELSNKQFYDIIEKKMISQFKKYKGF